MSKNVYIVNSTFRKNGNSEILAREFLRGAEEAGNKATLLNLRDLEMKFCVGCLACQKTGRCWQKDGVNAILPAVSATDVVVFATPIYYYSVSGQLKTLLDRMNALYITNNHFKEVYLLASCADTDENAVRGAESDIAGWVSCFDGVIYKGCAVAVGTDAPGDAAGSKAAEKAYRMGMNV